ncbi:hypothetical protein [Uliginosibacterium aquaticum]|uniref:Uncharacterized protein n=1 Tax=Uliginosibacterium aquaticum TaxID=2731212 RepID=A0ABX2IFS7_9RHOO|nr:hypothetical protein [Uliginosibacterium aquaticum]NSL55609.1 hypothetical protein [Uliginosibacterium aquaticum]
MNAPNLDSELAAEPAAKVIEPQEQAPLGDSKTTNTPQATAPEPVVDTPTPAKPDQVPPTEASAAEPEEPAVADVTEPEPQQSDRIAIRLSFIDPFGNPIKDLAYRVLVGGKTHEGKSDAKGLAADIEDVQPYVPLEILIKRDDGTWSSKYKGETLCTDMDICAKSPHLKLAITTEEHNGAPQKAPQTQPAPPKPAAPKPPLPLAGQISKAAPKPEVKSQPARNEQGHPVIRFGAAFDWAARVLPIGNPFYLYTAYKDWRKEKDKAAGAGNANSKTAANSGAAATTTSANKNPVPSSTKAAVTSLDQAPPLAVTQLVAIMEEQSKWQWKAMFEVKRLRTESILAGLENKTLEPDNDKPASKYDGRCYPSVKVGLKRANLVKDVWGDIPAKGAGAWLKSQGFIDVTKSLHDARWAAPGDIIVYRYDDETESANTKKHKAAFDKYEADKKAYPDKLKAWEQAHKGWCEQRKKLAEESALAAQTKGKPTAKAKLPKEPQKPAAPEMPNAENWGHIDVRTYDGYISDAKTRVLPRASMLNGRKGFVVTGIYRKIYDPLPDIRVRAFLKILREWEHNGEHEDKDRYFKLNYDYSKPLKSFSSTKNHPFEDISFKENTAAGAYQIKIKTYLGFIRPEYGIGDGFNPEQQDRIAVALIEEVAQGKILGLIREGKIEDAVNALGGKWSSLPSGREPRKGRDGKAISIEKLSEMHRNFMKELLVDKK